MRKICVVTGTRAEYGLLRWVMEGIKNDPELHLQVVVTGAHLSPSFGLTYKLIEDDGFFIDRKVEILVDTDTSVGVAKSLGFGVVGFADTLDDLKPDLLVLLGDRYEIFSAATAAVLAQIPVAHLHGGESTQGAYDDMFRHAITKMSQLHFVAAPQYKQRVIQLGEKPENVFMVGGLGVDVIKKTNLLSREQLEEDLGFKFGKNNLLVTFHPETLGDRDSEADLINLLAVLGRLVDTKLIITMPNADVGAGKMVKLFDEFCRSHANAHIFKSLGQLHYLSCVAQVDGVVGNSSSGLLEVPSFKKGTINIGNRQLVRLCAASVINTDPTQLGISRAISKIYSKEFQKKLDGVVNPYGDGGATERIIKTIKNINLKNITYKGFFDLPETSGRVN